MGTQKIVNLLNSSDNEYSKFSTKKWYVSDSESKGSSSHHDPTKFLTKSIESSLYDYCDAYILVTGNITVTRTIAAAGNNLVQKNQPFAAATQIAFYKDYRTKISDFFVDYADFINMAMPMYNLIEYSDNCSDSSGSL